MATIVLGIDPGIADTGYGVIEIEKNSITTFLFANNTLKKPYYIPWKIVNDYLI